MTQNLATLIKTQIQQPHWLVSAFVGAIIGLVLPSFLDVLRWPIRRLRRHQLNGEWNHYYYNFDPEQPVLHHEIWRVSPGIKSRFRVTVDDAKTKGPDYAGHIEMLKDIAIFQLRGLHHDELVVEKYPLPIPGSDSVMAGVAIAQDFQGRPSVNAVLLSRVVLSESEVHDILLERTKLIPNFRAMRVKR